MERKKRVATQGLTNSQLDRSLEKKHYARHYNDSVSTLMETKRTKSNYLNIKTQRGQSNCENNFGNSLIGIGEASRVN